MDDGRWESCRFFRIAGSSSMSVRSAPFEIAMPWVGCAQPWISGGVLKFKIAKSAGGGENFRNLCREMPI